jgi:hypothetical protein
LGTSFIVALRIIFHHTEIGRDCGELSFSLLK